MNQLPRRKLSEQIQIYKYEPTLRDIFVEGPIDKHFYEYFLQKLGVEKFRTYPIELIDFVGELELEDLSNRNKVAQLSLKLQNQFGNSLPFITCIIDKDYNDFFHEFDENFYLFFTDFTSLEMYFFNEDDLSKFLRLGIRDFPITAKKLIETIGIVLQEIFIINCAKLQHFKSSGSLKLDNAFVIEKNCTIDFNPEEYLNKFLLKNALSKQREYFIDKISSLRKMLTKDFRNQMRGKDVVELINKIIRIVKGNAPQFTEESLSRTLILLTHEKNLQNQNLFVKLLARYK